MIREIVAAVLMASAFMTVGIVVQEAVFYWHGKKHDRA